MLHRFVTSYILDFFELRSYGMVQNKALIKTFRTNNKKIVLLIYTIFFGDHSEILFTGLR